MVLGRAEPFQHRDTKTLVRVAEPVPNPLSLLLRSRAKANAR